MLIEKKFHLHQSLTEAKNRIRKLSGYRRQFQNASLAHATADGLAQFQFEPGFGFKAQIDLVEVPTDSHDEIAFKSIGGNVEVVGIIEFCEMKENLTEVCLCVDYQIVPMTHRIVDTLSGAMDRFVNTQLSRMLAHFEGVRTFSEREYGGSRALQQTPQLA